MNQDSLNFDPREESEGSSIPNTRHEDSPLHFMWGLVPTLQYQKYNTVLCSTFVPIAVFFCFQSLLTAQSVIACLHSCVSCPLEGASSLPVFTALFHALYSMMNEMLLHHQSIVLKSIPAFLSAAKDILFAFLFSMQKSVVSL